MYGLYFSAAHLRIQDIRNDIIEYMSYQASKTHKRCND